MAGRAVADELPCGPFRCSPWEGEDDGTDEGELGRRGFW